MYYGDYGKSIWKKAMLFKDKIEYLTVNKLSSNKDMPHKGPMVHFCEKTHILYIDWLFPFEMKQLGNKVHTSKVCNQLPTDDQVKSKRHYIPTTTKQQATNLFNYMNSSLYGMLLIMSTPTHNITRRNIYILPKIIVDGKFSNKKVYDMLNLNDNEIKWLQSTFNEDN